MRHACRRMRGNFSKDDRKGKRMARKIKYTRKDLKGPDELISTLGRATLWIKENHVPVLAALTAAAPAPDAAGFPQYCLGTIAFRRGNYDRSAEYFRSAIASGKEQGTVMDFLLREGLAQTFDAKGDAENAQKAYGEAAGVATGEFRIQARTGRDRDVA